MSPQKESIEGTYSRCGGEEIILLDSTAKILSRAVITGSYFLPMETFHAHGNPAPVQQRIAKR
jgi:hypothetical protein